jgi:hypothetical protein
LFNAFPQTKKKLIFFSKKDVSKVELLIHLPQQLAVKNQQLLPDSPGGFFENAICFSQVARPYFSGTRKL